MKPGIKPLKLPTPPISQKGNPCAFQLLRKPLRTARPWLATLSIIPTSPSAPDAGLSLLSWRLDSQPLQDRDWIPSRETCMTPGPCPPRSPRSSQALCSVSTDADSDAQGCHCIWHSRAATVYLLYHWAHQVNKGTFLTEILCQGQLSWHLWLLPESSPTANGDSVLYFANSVKKDFWFLSRCWDKWSHINHCFGI